MLTNTIIKIALDPKTFLDHLYGAYGLFWNSSYISRSEFQELQRVWSTEWVLWLPSNIKSRWRHGAESLSDEDYRVECRGTDALPLFTSHTQSIPPWVVLTLYHYSPHTLSLFHRGWYWRSTTIHLTHSVCSTVGCWNHHTHEQLPSD